MKFINNLERKFGRFAVHNLMVYIIGLNAVGLILYIFSPLTMIYLNWSMERILAGEIWRLVTFLLIPETTQPLMFLIYAVLYYSIGQTLERTWGTFRMNLYVYTGILGTILAGILVYVISGGRVDMYTMNIQHLNTSLFLALALTYPDAQFLLFFFVPVKAKWLAAFYVFLDVYNIFITVRNSGWMPNGISVLILTIVSMLNFIVYFFLLKDVRSGIRGFARRTDFRRKMNSGMGAGPSSGAGRIRPYTHKCTVCGCTEKDQPDRQFRFCTKCAGVHEYCSEHLYTHVHITSE